MATTKEKAVFPAFSLEIEILGREDSYVVYRDHRRRIVFVSGPFDTQHVTLVASRNLALEELREIVPNLATGLKKLGVRECTICREGGDVVARLERIAH